MKLEIINGSLGYDKKAILSNVNITIKKGEIVSILGQNGSGKTTLLKTLLGVLPTIEGEALLNNQRIEEWTIANYAQRVAYIPQAKSLPFPYRVFDVILFGRTAHLSLFGTPNKRDKEIAERTMATLGITHLKEMIYTNLSGGEQQMVIIARALVQEPDFLIMDEPTSNLDFGNQITIINQINSLKKDGIGVVMATHSPDHVFLCKSKIITIHKGIVNQIEDIEKEANDSLFSEIYGINIKVGQMEGTTVERKICVPIL